MMNHVNRNKYVVLFEQQQQQQWHANTLKTSTNPQWKTTIPCMLSFCRILAPQKNQHYFEHLWSNSFAYSLTTASLRSIYHHLSHAAALPPKTRIHIFSIVIRY